MNSRLICTLVTDGPRDQLLAAPLAWLLRELAGARFEAPRWADPRACGTTHKDGLSRRLAAALEKFRCDLLFVHRDAEDEPRELRKSQIESALAPLGSATPAVCVVPVRMSEAWFLFDPQAIRRAANNPSGSADLELPSLRNTESHKNPKAQLNEALINASGLTGRRLDKFQCEEAVYRLPNFLQDYRPLYELPAFAALREDLEAVLGERGWLKEKKP